ncbi:hypothetical protein HYS47_03470 [Candidatus Woesearchaeota archaeon]|nr:hypothetical protein [Candidatus Woesearchaeota archaeon]
MVKKRVLGSVLVSILFILLSIMLLSLFSITGLAVRNECCIDYTRGSFCTSLLLDGQVCPSPGTVEPRACEAIPDKCSIGCCVMPEGNVETRAKFSCQESGGVFRSGTEQPYSVGVEDLDCTTPLRCSRDTDCGAGLFCDTALPDPICKAGTTPTTCENNVRDGDETDVDCGGSCSSCAAGASCLSDTDCATSFCDASDRTCKPAAAVSCGDGFITTSRGEECEPPGSSGVSSSIAPGLVLCEGETLAQTMAREGSSIQCDMSCKVIPPSCPPPPTVVEELPPATPEGTSCGDSILDTPNAALNNEQCDRNGAAGIACSPFGTVGSACLSREDPLGRGCTCYAECLENPGSISTTAHQEVNRVIIEWDESGLVSSCVAGSWPKRFIYRCNEDERDCNLMNEYDIINATATTEMKYVDRTIEERTEYCYKVGVKLASGKLVTSPKQCLRTWSEICYGLAGGVGKGLCSDDRSAALVCDEQHVAQRIECGTGSICMESGFNPTCVSQQACDVCNGLFQTFGGHVPVPVSQLIEIAVGDGLQELACDEVLSCAYDTTEENVNAYQECSGITSCYDYHSEHACDGFGGSDPCFVGPCEWKEPYWNTVGFGICAPKPSTKLDCGRCNRDEESPDDAFNTAFFSECSQATCEEGYGDCYFDDGTCKAQTDVVCEDYATKAECMDGDGTGEAAFELDGNNGVAQYSNDRFEYGVCKWTDASKCFKDANADTVPDCSSADKPCQSDKQPPATIAVPTKEQIRQDAGDPPQRILVGKDADLLLSVSEPAVTYFCIDEVDPATPCSPTTPAVCKLQQRLDTLGDGNKQVRLFSVDYNDNVEQIQSIPVILDTTTPTITITPNFDEETKVLKVVMKANEQVRCSADMMNGNLEPARAVPGTSKSNAIQGEVGRTFNRTYYQLPDDLYYFVYDCKDAAGNRKQGYYAVSNVETNFIHPQRMGISLVTANTQLTVQVSTDQDAECRLSKTVSLFDGMEITSPRGRTHSANLPLTPGRNIYTIKCKTDDGTVHGNLGDRFIISRDVVPPKISFVQAYDGTTIFDPALSYAAPQYAMMACDDTAIPGGIVSNLGCQHTTYNLNGALTEVDHELGRLHGPIYFGDGTTALTYTARDQGGNSVTGSSSVTVTRGEKSMTIRITNQDGTPVEDAAKLQPALYYVMVSSTYHLQGAVVTIEMLEREEDTDEDREPDMLTLPSAPLLSSALEQAFILDLRLGTRTAKGEVYDVNIMAQGTITEPVPPCFEGDMAATTEDISAEVAAVVDARLVDIRLEPMLESRQTGPTGVEYNVSYQNNEYFTNHRDLFVTGKLLDPDTTGEVQFSIETFTSTWNGIDTLENNAEGVATEGFITSTVGEAAIGSSTVRVANPELITPGSYLLFKNHERVMYSRYRAFYPVADVDGDLILLAEPLEKKVGGSAGDVDVEIYRKPFPYNWFGMTVPLQEGRNVLSVKAKSTSGVYSPEKTVIIQRDTMPPEIIRTLPAFSITSDNVSEVAFIVREATKGSGIEKAEITMNSGSKPTTIEEIPSEAEGYLYYKVSFAQDIPFAEGTYTIKLVGYDRAKNVFSPPERSSFSLEIDRGAAIPPVWTVIGGTKKETALFGTLWYTPYPTIEVIIDFSANKLPIKITGMVIRAQGTTAQYPIGRTCEEVKLVGTEWVAVPIPAGAAGAAGTVAAEMTNKFRCRLAEPLGQNNAYQIGVRAHKVLTTGPLPDNTFFSDSIILDNQPPQVTSLIYHSPAKIEMPLEFYATVPNERYELGAKLTYSVNRETYNLQAVGGLNGNYLFIWDVPYFDITQDLYQDIDQDKEFLITIYDYADSSHTWEARRMIKIDGRPPELGSVQFSVEAPYSAVGILGKEYYTNAETVHITGNYTGDDVKYIYIEPGSFDSETGEFAARAHPLRLPNKKFMFDVKLQGEAEEMAENSFELVAVDDAGNSIRLPFKVWYDQTVPPKPQIIIE